MIPLTPSQARVLGVLAVSGGRRMTVQEVADAAGCSKSTAHVALCKLASHGVCAYGGGNKGVCRSLYGVAK